MADRDVWAEFVSARRQRRGRARPAAAPEPEAAGDQVATEEPLPTLTDEFLAGRVALRPGTMVPTVSDLGRRFVPAENVERLIRDHRGRIAEGDDRAALEQERSAAAEDPGGLATALAASVDPLAAPVARALGDGDQVDFWSRQYARHPNAALAGDVAGVARDAALIWATGGAATPLVAEARLGAGAVEVAEAASGAGRMARLGQLAARLTPGGLGTAAREGVESGVARMLSGAVREGGLARAGRVAGELLGEGVEAGTYGAYLELSNQLSRDEELSGEALLASFTANAFIGAGVSAGLRGLGAAARLAVRRSRGTPLGDALGVRQATERLTLASVSNAESILPTFHMIAQEQGQQVADAALAGFRRLHPELTDLSPEGLARWSRHLNDPSPLGPDFGGQVPEGTVQGWVRRVGGVMADPQVNTYLGHLSRPQLMGLRSAGREVTEGVGSIGERWRELERAVRQGEGAADDLAIRLGYLDGVDATAARRASRLMLRSTNQDISTALTGLAPDGSRVALSFTNREVTGLLRGAMRSVAEADAVIRQAGTSSSQMFRTLNDLKRKLYSGVRALEDMEGVPVAERSGARDLYGRLAQHLEDPLVWGERTAQLQGRVNRAFTGLGEAESVLTSRGMARWALEGGRRRLVPDGQRIRSWLTSRVTKPFDAEEIDTALNAYNKHVRDLHDAYVSVGAESNLGEHVDRLNRQILATRKASDVIALADDVIRKERYASSLGIVAAGGSLVGSAVAGGATSYALGGDPISGAMVGASARLAWGAVSRPAQTMIFLAGMRGAAQRLTTRFDRGMGAIRRAISTGSRGKMPRPPVALAALLRPETRERAYDQAVDDLRRLQEQPEELLARVGNATRGLDDRGEGAMAREAGMTAIRAVAHLNQHLPPASAPSLFGPPRRRPSVAEMDSFIRRWHAINDPLALLEMIAAGRVAREHAEAVREVYPRLHLEMTTKLVREMTRPRRGNRPLPYWLRLSAGTGLNIPADDSLNPAFLEILQGRSAQTPAQAQAVGLGSMPARTPGKIQVSEEYQAGGSRLEAEL